MAIEKHVVELAAKDNLSPALKNVATAADKAGKSAEDAGRKGTKATQDWSKAASNMGRVLGGLSVIAIKLGNESEVSQKRLEQSIANTGDSYDLLKDKIDATTDAALKLGFDDEDAIDAITTLTDATGDAEKAMSDLSIAQDIARGRGISLAAATNIVVAAEQGRYGALKRMGIAIDETATSEEALAALHTKYAGQAEAYATTNAAAWDRMGNTIENHLEALGGVLADVQGPMIALGGASQLIGPLGDAFEALGGKAKIASLATSALSSSFLGPLGLVVGAAAVGAALYTLITTESQAEQQANALTKATDAYTASIVTNATALAMAGVYDQVQATKELLGVWITDGLLAQTRIDEVNTSITEMQAALGQALPDLYDSGQAWETIAAGMNTLDSAQKDYIKGLLESNGALADGVVTAEELSAILPSLSSGFELSATQATALTTAMQGVEEAAANPQLYGQDIAAKSVEILNDMHDGVISVDDAIKQLNALPANPKYVVALAEANKLMQEQMVHLHGLEFGMGGVAANTLTASTGMHDLAGASVEAGRDTSHFNDELAALGDTLKSTGSEGLERYMKMIVGFTNGIVDSIGSAKDWADALIAPVGTYSDLDKMLADGTIRIDQYNEAQKAQVSITDDYNRAAAARNEIQAKQAPLIAQQSDAATVYLETIADMTEKEQTLALAWADTDLAGRAEDIANMATEFDDMSDAQQDAFENMVTSAAATDPALAGVLEDLGLIKASTTDPTGWTVSMDTSDSETDLERVAGSIDDLVAILAQMYHLNVDTSFDTRTFYEIYNNLPSHHTIYIHTANGGGFGYQPIQDALGGTAKDDLDHAALGRMGRGLTLVGEHGPEMVTLPHGSMVTPNHATRYASRDGAAPTMVIQQMTVVASSPAEFMRQMREYEKGMNRR